MKKIAILFFVLMCAGLQTFAAECTVQFSSDRYLNKVKDIILKSTSCEEGAHIAEACALGASGDLQTVPVAIEKCEIDFMTKLSTSDKVAYHNLQSKCFEKYETLNGSMYKSMAIFCSLQVSRLYSELYTPAD